VSNFHHDQPRTLVDNGGHHARGQACNGPGSLARYLASGRRGHIAVPCQIRARTARRQGSLGDTQGSWLPAAACPSAGTSIATPCIMPQIIRQFICLIKSLRTFERSRELCTHERSHLLRDQSEKSAISQTLHRCVHIEKGRLLLAPPLSPGTNNPFCPPRIAAANPIFGPILSA
jgi:hypothetical protein